MLRGNGHDMLRGEFHDMLRGNCHDMPIAKRPTSTIRTNSICVSTDYILYITMRTLLPPATLFHLDLFSTHLYLFSTPFI